MQYPVVEQRVETHEAQSESEKGFDLNIIIFGIEHTLCE